jgi:ABC-type protease/lipase transport system fused ATPase/permease subunit
MSHQKYQALILDNTLAQVAADIRDGKTLDSVSRERGQDLVDLVKLVQDAAVQADAASFIDKLEYGYGTSVGTGGKLVRGKESPLPEL